MLIRLLRALALFSATILLGGCQLTHWLTIDTPAPVDVVHTPAPAAASPPAVTPVAMPPASAPVGSIWRQIAEAHTLPLADDTRIAAARRQLLSSPTHLTRVSERAAPFIGAIVDALQQRGMPVELALLPFIESAFQADARHRGGAAGLWQFMPATARKFGLQRNWWYDGRFDVPRATQAALDYLAEHHRRFGDWLLAVAAYNCGEGTMARALRKNRDAGLAVTFWALDLPRETRRYIPRLLALLSVLREPQAYGVQLYPVPVTPRSVPFDTGGQLDLATAARLADMPLAALTDLNPAFRQGVMPPDGPFTLLLPVDRQATFSRALAALPTDQRVRWNHHVVRRGDSLWRISRRYAMSLQALKTLNQLSSNLLRPGQVLKVSLSGAEKI